MRSVLVAVVVVLSAAVHASVWLYLSVRVSPPDATNILESVSFSPVRPDLDGEVDGTTEAQIIGDLKAIAPYTGKIRTYGSTNGLDLVPQLAAQYGLRVTLGAWIDQRDGHNEKEIESAIALAKNYRNIDSVIVGNETIYRNRAEEDDAVQDIIGKIQRVKRAVSVPVSTAEVWDVWLDHPELVAAVDYIAVHILPYWEGLPGDVAVDHAMQVYRKLREAYPGKHIVIAEFGWPSAGLNRKDAVPGKLIQAQIIRDFITRTDAMGIDYSIVEAFDQPWKTSEGSVGPYWGLFNADRQRKFELSGPVDTPKLVQNLMTAIGIGFLLSLAIFAIPRVTLIQAGILAVTAQAIGAWAAGLIDYWDSHYFVLGAQIALFAGVALLVPLVVIMRLRVDEIAAILFGAAPARLLDRPKEALPAEPLVSIHIPSYREPPAMLRETLDSIAKITWANFECIVVINNTPDPELWMPIEEHCRLLGPRFKFIREENVKGFKAGALRLALENTAPDAKIIGVIDADYVVHPNWLKDLVPTFADPEVGLVQAPQDHRDCRTITDAMMNGEYAGFFDIGMVQRNEANAIVTHGTMCLLRRDALLDAGNWSSDTIVEDADLGLTLLERGWRAHYTQTRYGWGLLPSDFTAYKQQRHRWAYGGVQLIRKHWRAFLPGGSHLTPQQKREFLIGWLTWLGAESLGVVIAILNLIWMPLVAFGGIAIPDSVLLIPVIAMFLVTIVHFLLLYRTRLHVSVSASIGAALAAMALQFTVGRAVFDGLIRERLPFARTAKGAGKSRSSGFPAIWEAAVGGLLLLGSLLLYVMNDQVVREISFFSIVLLIQSLPFLAAAAICLLARSHLNAFAAWRKWNIPLTIFPRRRRGQGGRQPVTS